jgi:hypothetical protein
VAEESEIVAVYVDFQRNSLGRMKMCHMIADTLDELHAMAQAIGMRREWFQDTSFPHYDVSLTRRSEAVRRGAVELERREFVRRMRLIRASWVCSICKRRLNTEDRLSNDCGGDCWGCVSHAEASALGVDVEKYRADPERYLKWNN